MIYSSLGNTYVGEMFLLTGFQIFINTLIDFLAILIDFVKMSFDRFFLYLGQELGYTKNGSWLLNPCIETIICRYFSLDQLIRMNRQ